MKKPTSHILNLDERKSSPSSKGRERVPLTKNPFGKCGIDAIVEKLRKDCPQAILPKEENDMPSREDYS